MDLVHIERGNVWLHLFEHSLEIICAWKNRNLHDFTIILPEKEALITQSIEIDRLGLWNEF